MSRMTLNGWLMMAMLTLSASMASCSKTEVRPNPAPPTPPTPKINMAAMASGPSVWIEEEDGTLVDISKPSLRSSGSGLYDYKDPQGRFVIRRLGKYDKREGQGQKSIDIPVHVAKGCALALQETTVRFFDTQREWGVPPTWIVKGERLLPRLLKGPSWDGEEIHRFKFREREDGGRLADRTYDFYPPGTHEILISPKVVGTPDPDSDIGKATKPKKDLVYPVVLAHEIVVHTSSRPYEMGIDGHLVPFPKPGELEYYITGTEWKITPMVIDPSLPESWSSNFEQSVFASPKYDGRLDNKSNLPRLVGTIKDPYVSSYDFEIPRLLWRTTRPVNYNVNHQSLVITTSGEVHSYITRNKSVQELIKVILGRIGIPQIKTLSCPDAPKTPLVMGSSYVKVRFTGSFHESSDGFIWVQRD